MDNLKSLGFNTDKSFSSGDKNGAIQYINLKLAAMGSPTFGRSDYDFLTIAHDLLQNYQEKNRLLAEYLCPADYRIQCFLNNHFNELLQEQEPRLPSETFILDRHGLARTLSLAPDKSDFSNKYIKSFRITQGILNNPVNDRRTTEGVFHITEGGFPISDDKKAVPKGVFANLLIKALAPPDELLELPFTTSQDEKAKLFVSLLIRPTVCPQVEGFTSRKSMEIRFFAPGGMVSNLDFVESIFGNAGDPYLAVNDAGLDIDAWTGHTGCVLLAPHLTSFTKKELGLPKYSEANSRQKRDGMCWKEIDELYNEGKPFKICCRTEEGIIVTLIADNYFGYCKKEVKTQINYSANLFGLSEEEHAGGALVFPVYNLGETCAGDNILIPQKGHTFSEVAFKYRDKIHLKPSGYGIDKRYSGLIYIPENARIDINRQTVSWHVDEIHEEIKLLKGNTYIYPSGYKVEMVRHLKAPSWYLIGTVPEGTFCHKPCTVSGGGKSEISKPLAYSIQHGPVFIADVKKDLDLVDSILQRNYRQSLPKEAQGGYQYKTLLSPDLSLGTVIRLLTPFSSDYTDEYNTWLDTIPDYIKGLVFLIKRFYRPEWGDQWREHFGVDVVNGKPGHEFKFDDRHLVARYLRIGKSPEGSWLVHRIRQDFIPCKKIQLEDDISVSIIVPSSKLKFLNPEYNNPCFKFIHNCEYRFFQRPDDVVIRGFDKEAELDLTRPDSFISNFEPLPLKEATQLIEDAVGFDDFSHPMRRLIKESAKGEKDSYFVSSAHPRIVKGVPTKNPRYLQTRPDLLNPEASYIAEMGTRMYRRIPLNEPVHVPVTSVLPGRRNNPQDKKAGIRALAVYGPIHYQPLPELFMDFICSLTGKSPSTTGAGSEGALTKRAFNALSPVIDLNNALIGFILTASNCFTTAAGFIGSKLRVEHDISLLIPELWSRMTEKEREPEFLIHNGCLEKMDDFEHNGELILASRLGYRITEKFLHMFFGRIFGHPTAVFDEEMLRPELQDQEAFVDGVKNVVEAQAKEAKRYFKDGSIEGACPPLKALLHIMVNGSYEGKGTDSPEIRSLFDRSKMLESDWYKQRLETKQQGDIELMTMHIEYLTVFLKKKSHSHEASKLNIKDRLAVAEKNLVEFKTPEYLESLRETIGTDPLCKSRSKI